MLIASEILSLVEHDEGLDAPLKSDGCAQDDIQRGGTDWWMMAAGIRID